MNQTVERRIRTQRSEDLRRLADQGERAGVRVLIDHRTGTHVATSASDPTRCYVVSVEGGCTCKGYLVWGRCQHFAVLLAQLGRIPDVAPLPLGRSVERPACPACHGRGWGYADVGSDRWPAQVPCRACVQVAVEALAGDVNERGTYVMGSDRPAA